MSRMKGKKTDTHNTYIEHITHTSSRLGHYTYTCSTRLGINRCVCQSCSWSAEEGKLFHSRLGVWSREAGSAILSRVSPVILHTQAESSAYSSRVPLLAPASRDGIHPYRQPPLCQPRVYRVTQLRTYVVHQQASAGTGQVVLKVVRVTGATSIQATRWTNFCAPLFCGIPVKILLYTFYWYVAFIWKIEITSGCEDVTNNAHHAIIM